MKNSNTDGYGPDNYRVERLTRILSVIIRVISVVRVSFYEV